MGGMESCSKTCCGCAHTAPGASDSPLPLPEPPSGSSGAALATLSLYAIPGMDCPSEERLIRLALQGVGGVQGLSFDLPARRLQVRHRGPTDEITAALQPLAMGAQWLSSSDAAGDAPAAAPASSADESGVLRWLLGLNALMFVVEVVAGWWAQSTGLIADSLDMFADAAVYGVALLAVGRDGVRQKRAARLSGWLQMALAAGALFEVARRALGGSTPEAPTMMGVAALALAVNLACVALLARHRDGGVHMKASWIFSTNDALANLGVILAGALVAWTGSNLPDLVIGLAIALLVASGARRILALSA